MSEKSGQQTDTGLYARFGIAALCFGYFAAYVPYGMLTKMLTKGLLPSQSGHGFDGFVIQPAMIMGSLFFMVVFITVKGWWKYATHRTIAGLSIPVPRWFTFVSGLCTAGQVITTTMAYTFSGVSIVFAMLLMRGGVLIMAPVIDLIARRRKRRIYWPSWVAALLSLGAVLAAVFDDAGTVLTVLCAVDISLYLFVYFFRLLFMSNQAKSDDEGEKIRYFAEEQLVANPALLLVLALSALAGMHMEANTIPNKLWQGFTWFLQDSGFFWVAFLNGIFSAGTGLFGGLIYLDKRENTFTVPANRVASVLAGVLATYLLAFFYNQSLPSRSELIGASMVVAAIVFLAYRSVVEKRARLRAQG
jgi:hypothetical protein